jgi:hypothetical protein
MAKPLKIISINFPFEDRSVRCQTTLNTTTELFDFDVVVIRLFSLGDERWI